jgi:MFS transporter, ACS family, hexuronate transporter
MLTENSASTPSRGDMWRWTVSALLLFATMINYMDRQTLANLSVRIMEEFSLKREQYGNIEFLFGVSFAFGSLFFGYLVDFVSVRWLYPTVLIAWSVVGFVTGFTDGYESLFVCRGLLGFFEAGHWPCAMVVTQSIMSRKERVMGNSLLQSGASIGAILTPIVIRLIMSSSTSPSAWRLPFFVIGATGLIWAAFWFFVIGKNDLVRDSKPTFDFTWVKDVLVDRRFWALAAMVICINTSWQLVRAWLPSFLQEGRGYSEKDAMYFNSLYYVATDVGCIAAGIAALVLTRRGWSVHSSRVSVYLICSLLACLSTLAAFLPQGWPLLGVLLLVGAGSLGVFPCYYSFSQEMSVTHLGRVSGLLSFLGWLMSSPTQKLFGRVVDQTKSYDLNIAILGWSPFVGLVIFWLLWPHRSEARET